MSIKQSVAATFTLKDIEVRAGRMELSAEVKISFRLPAHNRQLPAEMEEVVEATGQSIKQEMYRWVMEGADEDLITRLRAEREFTRRGKKDYTIKAVFGKVVIKRTRICARNDSTEIPAHLKWRTPQQVLVTKGLRAAVCDLAVKESITSTLAAISTRLGGERIMSERSVLNILHREGAALIAAQEERARAVYEAIPSVSALWRSSGPISAEFDHQAPQTLAKTHRF